MVVFCLSAYFKVFDKLRLKTIKLAANSSTIYNSVMILCINSRLSVLILTGAGVSPPLLLH